MRRSLLLGFLLLLAARGAAGQIRVEQEPLHENRPARLVLDAPADTLYVRYRPNSSVFRDELVPVPAGSTEVEWTPREAGVVALRASGAAAWQNVSVRFDHYPIGGILVLLVAGTILFGGAGFSLAALFRGGAAPDPTERPDT